MANISSIGIGSGVLTSDLIDQLSSAERAPTELRLDRKEAEVEAKLSAVGRINSALIDLRLPSRILSNPDALNSLEASSTSSNITVTADSAASTGQYALDVTSLAQAQSLRSSTYVDKDSTTMGSGTLSFKVGDTTTNIDIDATNNTLQGIASAVNADEDLAVNASVIDTGSGFVLVFSAKESGLENAMEITVTDTGDGNSDDALGLSQFTFNQSFTHINESVIPENAKFSVNGIDIERASNTITDVVEGVSFTLTGATTSPATITVSRDTDAVLERVQEFIDKFNEVKNILNELTEFNPAATAESGILLGDSTVRAINTQMRQILGQVVPGLGSSSVRSLAEIGISTDRTTGNLSIDEIAFKKQLNNNPEDVVALFADQGRTTDAQVSFVSKTIDTVPGSYNVNITTAATRGEMTGALGLGASTTIDANNDELTIKIDGATSGAIFLDVGSYTQEEMVVELQAKINADETLSAAGKSVVVSLDGSNNIVINSSEYGSNSKVEITAVDVNTAAQLGLSVATGTDGVDVEGTINGVAATGSGQILTAAEGDDSEGLKIKIEGIGIGDRGKVTYIEGVAEQLVDKLNSFLEFEGIVGAKENGLNANLAAITLERTKLDERVETLRSRLARQFTAADILVGQLNSTRDFLKTQLDALAGIKNE
jgi:flagellar hook-associated protein 2